MGIVMGFIRRNFVFILNSAIEVGINSKFEISPLISGSWSELLPNSGVKHYNQN